MEKFQNAVTQKIAEFLTGIGIGISPAKLDDKCFLPGIFVKDGGLLIDEAEMEYPGDLLHEAGHLAIAPADIRPNLSGEVIIPGANMDLVEIQATAWAYAASVFLELSPQTLFHQGGYDGKSESLIFTFGAGIFPGASQLEDFGLTACGENAVKLGAAPYPQMLKWLRD